jgi:hypothetical protein
MGILDPRLAALAWLLVEGGVPLLVTGPAGAARRAELAGALLSLDPDRPWLVLDADDEPPTVARLAALLQGGASFAISLSAAGLSEALERLHAGPGRLPYDALRRLGLVATVDETERGLRCRVVHFLRPTERDGQGHVQRRPPAILASWDEGSDRYDDYAWGITPELAERVGRTQADLEERRDRRAGFLAAVARREHVSAGEWHQLVRRHLQDELPGRAPEGSPQAREPGRGV